MSDEAIDRTAERIAEHAHTHRLGGVTVVVHGGEPLLAGTRRLRRVATALRDALGGVELDLRMQTNGLLLAEDERLCRDLAACGYRIGVSIDGDRVANDRHRRYRDGRSSYEQVIRAVARLSQPRYRDTFAGLLCVVNPENDPVAAYDAIAALDPPRIDFLLPHATWDQPPRRESGSATAFADWLLAVYRRWDAADRPVPIRIFDSILSRAGGGPSLTESLGTDPSDLVVIETDGSIEQADSLKTAYDGAPATGFSVWEHSFDTAAGHPGFAARRDGKAGLCDKCRRCPVVTVCGGGLYAHRYRTGSRFDNPSVYCTDLLKIIETVTSSGVRMNTPPPSGPTHGLTSADFDEIATGFGSEAAVRELMGVEESLNRALVSVLCEDARARGGDARRLVEVLGELGDEAPDAYATVMAHPFTRLRLANGVSRLREPRAGPVDLNGLGVIAIATAVNAGFNLSLRLRLSGGILDLPTLGRFELAAQGGVAPAPAAVDVRVSDGSVTLAGAGGRDVDARWKPVRHLEAEGLRLALEDTDPYRECYALPVESRLTGRQVTRWQALFSEAWRIMRRDHAGYLPGMMSGLRAVVPLVPGTDHQVSATAREAAGSVAVAVPGRPDELALVLLHEHQHVKLGALLTMYGAFTESDQQFRVPWRPDLRPAEATLQGCYAHVAVADVWRSRWLRADDSEGEEAGARYCVWRERAAKTIDTLLESRVLIGHGVRFAEVLAARLHGMLSEPLPSPVRQRARALADGASHSD